MAAENPAAHKGSYHQLFASVKDKDIEQADGRTAKEMNRYGVNAWETCLQKKTKELGRAENIGRYQLPDECKCLIWKFLGATVESALGGLRTSAELKTLAETRRKEMIRLMATAIINRLSHMAKGQGSWGCSVNRQLYYQLMDECGLESQKVCAYMGKNFPRVEPLMKALEELGYECEAGDDLEAQGDKTEGGILNVFIKGLEATK